MIGLGTLINVVTVLIGGAMGLLLGSRLSAKIRETIMDGLGLLTVIIGISLALETSNILIVLGSLLIGGIIGELLDIEGGIDRLGQWLEHRTGSASVSTADNDGDGSGSKFSYAFLMASLLFCVGPMTILGSIQDGLSGDYTLLAVKAVMDGFAALAFASTLGGGVLFSALTVLLYQGALTIGASWASAVLTDPMTAEMTATGGVLMLALGLGLLEIKRVRTGNLLPALIAAPAIVALASWLHWM